MKSIEAALALLRAKSFALTELEACESLEQLRFIAHGWRFQTIETDHAVVAIDTPADLENARALMA